MNEKLQIENTMFLLEHVILEIEEAIGEITHDKIAPGLHRLQGLIEFLTPGFESVKSKLEEMNK